MKINMNDYKEFRIQHGISDGEEDIDDINVLKTKSFNNLTNNRLTPPVLESSSQPSKREAMKMTLMLMKK